MDDVIDEARKLRVDLVERGYFGSRIHASRASVFSHPDTGDHEFFLHFKEKREDTLARFEAEKERVAERRSAPVI